MLRGDLTRMLIIAPGGLVEQWQDELATRFGITAELLSREMITGQVDSNPFTRYPILIARMDQLACNDDLLALLDASDWDLIVVDGLPHVGQLLQRGVGHHPPLPAGPAAGRDHPAPAADDRHPHAGSESAFQAFMALLDPDRFEGEYRSSAHPPTPPA